ncbi:MAG: hypothetical protein JWN84_2989 [Nocardioides sp.]|nr:hypothetical protein [Nocardioides sp.]
MDSEPVDETFPPTGGRLSGLFALAIGALLVVLGLVDGVSLVSVGFGLLFAALAWTSLLRPRVAIESDHLVLRNMVNTVRVPLAAVEEVVVRQVLAVRAGDKRYTSPAIGRTRRQLTKEGLRGAASNDAGSAEPAFGVFVQDRIRQRAKEARDRAGITLASAEQDALAERVRREPAVPEILMLAGSAVFLVVAFAL